MLIILQLFLSALFANFAFKYLLHELRESIETTVASRRLRTASLSEPTIASKHPDKTHSPVQLNVLEKVRFSWFLFSFIPSSKRRVKSNLETSQSLIT